MNSPKDILSHFNLLEQSNSLRNSPFILKRQVAGFNRPSFTESVCDGGGAGLRGTRSALRSALPRQASPLLLEVLAAPPSAWEQEGMGPAARLQFPPRYLLVLRPRTTNLIAASVSGNPTLVWKTHRAVCRASLPTASFPNLGRELRPDHSPTASCYPWPSGPLPLASENFSSRKWPSPVPCPCHPNRRELHCACAACCPSLSLSWPFSASGAQQVQRPHISNKSVLCLTVGVTREEELRHPSPTTSKPHCIPKTSLAVTLGSLFLVLGGDNECMWKAPF